MKNFIIVILILFNMSYFAQNLIGMSSAEIQEMGLNKYDDSTYISIDSTAQINAWVSNDTVIVEQYVVTLQKDVEELYVMLEDDFILTEIKGRNLFFSSKKTGVVCVVNRNTFTLYYGRL